MSTSKTPEEILTTATLRAAEFFGVSYGELATILGVDAAKIDDMRAGRYAPPPRSPALGGSSCGVGKALPLE